MDLSFIQTLVELRQTPPIVLLVMDGLGGLPVDGATELESAHTPHLDALAGRAICGLHEPVGPGITPGSGPSHLALFGYDPLTYQVGRGVLSALGIDFDLTDQDVAARGNFCTLDERGRVADRRAGRISTKKNVDLCALLREIELPGAKLYVETVKEHRFLLVLRGDGLSGAISDTDPQALNVEPLAPEPLSSEAEGTASLVRAFLAQADELLAGHDPANMVLLRGFAQRPKWPSVQEVFGLRAAAIAAYPMYRGVAKLVGMEPLKAEQGTKGILDLLKERWDDYSFFFVHVKGTDSAGEDGDFERKVAQIEEVDALIPRVLDLGPDVLIVTGDHSTPAGMQVHSWHPVPVLLWSKVCRADSVDRFGERACLAGALGPRMAATELMPLALANSGRLAKFGA
jgi:2,3-bisphosphoglycerate-independent phosphoglycerate mutase